VARRPPLLWALLLPAWVLIGASLFEYLSGAGEPRAPKQSSETPTAASADDEPLKRPDGWPDDLPLPTVNSNCVRCHLTAGRELTVPVVDFARSVHDLHDMSCSDCHGGNRDDDTKAHEEEFGFIGTKLSGHIKTCSDCHSEEAELLAAGPHHWDFSTRINTKYPMCIDCHGNHDVGNPPEDFKLLNVCGDCHEKLETDYPAYHSVVAANDQLWGTLIQVRHKNQKAAQPVPDEFSDEIAGLRRRTMEHLHGVGELAADEAASLNRDVASLGGKLEKWLRESPHPKSATKAD